VADEQIWWRAPLEWPEEGKGRTTSLARCAVAAARRPGAAEAINPYLWKRDGERAASINVTAEAERFILPFEHGSVGADWRSEQYPVLLKRETVRTVSNRHLANVP